MRLSLHEIGEQLRHARIKGRQLLSPDCPCCGGHRKRHKTALSACDKGDFILLRCFKCGSNWQDIARGLGIENGRGFTTTHLEACARDAGPFRPEQEVLAKVAVGMFELLPADAFPHGRIGGLARIVAEHTLSARRRTGRLRFPAEESPFSVKWCGNVLRKLGYRISNEDAGLVRDTLARSFETKRHLATNSREDESGPFVYLVVDLARPLHSRSVSSGLGQILSNTALSVPTATGASVARLSMDELLADLRPKPPPSRPSMTTPARGA